MALRLGRCAPSLRAFSLTGPAMSEPDGSPEAKRQVSRMVEAAGVEPASERTSSQTTTCVSPFSCRDRFETEPKAPAAIPDVSHPSRVRAARRQPARLNDSHPRATGLLWATAHWLLSSESVVCVRSYVSFPPRIYEGEMESSARAPRSRTPVEARSPPTVALSQRFFILPPCRIPSPCRDASRKMHPSPPLRASNRRTMRHGRQRSLMPELSRRMP